MVRASPSGGWICRHGPPDGRCPRGAPLLAAHPSSCLEDSARAAGRHGEGARVQGGQGRACTGRRAGARPTSRASPAPATRTGLRRLRPGPGHSSLSDSTGDRLRFAVRSAAASTGTASSQPARARPPRSSLSNGTNAGCPAVHARSNQGDAATASAMSAMPSSQWYVRSASSRTCQRRSARPMCRCDDGEDLDDVHRPRPPVVAPGPGSSPRARPAARRAVRPAHRSARTRSASSARSMSQTASTGARGRPAQTAVGARIDRGDDRRDGPAPPRRCTRGRQFGQGLRDALGEQVDREHAEPAGQGHAREIASSNHWDAARSLSRSRPYAARNARRPWPLSAAARRAPAASVSARSRCCRGRRKGRGARGTGAATAGRQVGVRVHVRPGYRSRERTGREVGMRREQTPGVGDGGTVVHADGVVQDPVERLAGGLGLVR